MSNYRQAPSAGAKNDDKGNPPARRPGMRITEVEETSGMVMMAHYDDARLNPNNNRGNNNNYSTLSAFSPEQQASTAITGTAANNAYTSPYAATQNTNNTNFNDNEYPPWPAVSSSTATTTNTRTHAHHICSHCSSTGHRRPECPHLPCKHCDLMGHVGIDCPEMAKVRAERRQMTSKRWYENNRANRK